MPIIDLGMEIADKIEKKEHFSFRHITLMMYDLIEGFYHFHKMGISLGKFGPEYCPRTANGYSIIEDPFFNREGIVNLKTKRNLYLSPESYYSAKNMKMTNNG